MKRKRVCEISGSYFVRDPRVRREAEALANAGWQVDVICLRAPGEPRTSSQGSSIRIVRVPLQHKRGSRLRYLLEYGAFFALASTTLSLRHALEPYDLVHVHTMPDALVFTAWLPKLTRTPILLDIHEPMPETFQARFQVPSEHWLSRALVWQERVSFAFADYLITIHEPMARLFSRRSTPAEKIAAIMNVPDPAVFALENHRERAPKDTFTLLYTGTVTFHYGLDVAVRAVARLRDQIPTLRFRVVGDGDDLPRLRSLTSELQLDDHIEFLPPVPLDKIPEIASTSDVMVSPHRRDAIAPWYFGTKIAEALLLGLPVISSRTETLEYYFDDAMVAYCEPGDPDALAAQVLRLYRNPDTGAEMVRNARNFFKDHSWERERLHLYEVVEQLSNHASRSNGHHRRTTQDSARS